MTRFGFLVCALLLAAPPAFAQSPSWSLISFAGRPQDVPAVMKAADKLMQSEVGKEFPGQLLLLVNIADGDNPATHSFVPVYSSTADRERFVGRMQGTSDWNRFLKVLGKKTRPVSTTLYRTVQGWGDQDDADSVWMTHAFRVSDPPAFQDAIQRFMSSRTGRSFPGQVYLSAVVAGGGRTSHVISVGYASETEMDAWTERRNASAPWAAYLQRSNKVSEYLGGTLSRELKSWGSASVAELSPAR